ncbi:hypothetical protein [Streptomyces maremycinicus]|uniref:hypothetical protein n=1 Tax=Streptomyces maremycinicus TaxID=1679753 RepID=UPI0018FF014B|nr:hypothetical protein [Streptomyces sp. NBRC 110468]
MLPVADGRPVGTAAQFVGEGGEWDDLVGVAVDGGSKMRATGRQLAVTAQFQR